MPAGAIRSAHRQLLLRARQLLGVIRLRPFDGSTEAGRSLERHRRIVLSAIAALAARAVSIITVLVTVPLTLKYLGDERYGLWMTISSVIAMLGFADLGLGNGLLTGIAQAHGRADTLLARRFISSALLMLTAAALVIVGVFLLAYPWIDWPGAFKVTSPTAAAEAGPAVAVFILCFAANLPCSLVGRVQSGYQEGVAASLWTAAGNIAGLFAVLAAIRVHAGLPWLVGCVAGAPAAVALLNGLVFFGLHRPALRPSFRLASLSTARRLLTMGVLYFVLQVAMAFAFASDNVIITRVLGPAQVAQYAVPSRLFGTVGMILLMVLMPLWPAYGESITRGDIGWVRRMLRRSLALTFLLSGAGAAILLVLGRQILALWVGPNIQPSSSLLVALAIWAVLSSCGQAVSIFLNGLNWLRGQAIAAIALAIVGLILKIAMARIAGVNGVAWAMDLAYLACIALPLAVLVPRLVAALPHRSPPTGTPTPFPHSQAESESLAATTGGA